MKFFPSFLGISLLTCLVNAESPNDSPHKLTEPSELVALALENNLGLQVSRLEVEVRDELVSSEKGRFYPVASFEVGVDRIYRRRNAEERQSDNLFGATKPEANFAGDTRYATINVGGRLPLGTTYELSAASTRNANTYTRRLTSLYNPEYVTDFRLRVVQPLGRNFGLEIGLAPMNISRAEREIAKLETQAAIESVMAQVLLACYEVYFAAENIKVKQESVELANRLRLDNSKRVDQGRMSKIAITQAEARIAEAEAELISAQVFYEERQARLQELTQQNYSFNAKPYHFESMGSALPTPETVTDPGGFAQVMFTNNGDYLAALKKVEAEGYRVKLSKNQVYPEVNLIMSVGLSGLENDFGSSYQDAGYWDYKNPDGSDREGPNWGVGIAVNFPLNNLTAKSEWRAAQKRESQSLIRVKQTEIQLLRTLDTSIQELRAGLERRRLIGESVRLASEALDAELTRLTNGVTTNLEVLNQQRELSVSRSQALSAEVEIHKAWLQLLLLQGTLGQNLGFELEFEI